MDLVCAAESACNSLGNGVAAWWCSSFPVPVIVTAHLIECLTLGFINCDAERQFDGKLKPDNGIRIKRVAGGHFNFWNKSTLTFGSTAQYFAFNVIVGERSYEHSRTITLTFGYVEVSKQHHYSPHFQVKNVRRQWCWFDFINDVHRNVKIITLSLLVLVNGDIQLRLSRQPTKDIGIDCFDDVISWA